MRTKILLISFLTLTSAHVLAQSTTSQAARSGVGVTASVQSEQLEFLLPIWFGNRVTLSPSISLVSVQDLGSDLSIGLVPRFYLSDTEGAAPFVTFRFGAIIGMPSEGDNITDFVFGTGFGGEYFFKPKFSVGIELQGNFSVSDTGSFRFGNPGNINFNTATALTASIYF